MMFRYYFGDLSSRFRVITSARRPRGHWVEYDIGVEERRRDKSSQYGAEDDINHTPYEFAVTWSEGMSSAAVVCSGKSITPREPISLSEGHNLSRPTGKLEPGQEHS